MYGADVPPSTTRCSSIDPADATAPTDTPSSVPAQVGTDVELTGTSESFRLRAGALIVRDGAVLMAHTAEEPSLYYTVGGAVQVGETAEEAVRREVREELGVDLPVGRLCAVHENFFGRRGRRAHEVAFYFLLADDPRIPAAPVGHDEVGVPHEDYRWVPIQDLADLESYPVFLADIVTRTDPGVSHIVTHED